MTEDDEKILAEACGYLEVSSPATRFARLREERNLRLYLSDRYMVIDCHRNHSERFIAMMKAYRQALRDLPAQAGAPWTPGTVPWPERPEERDE